MEEKMLAAVFEGEGKFILKEVPVPRAQKDDDVIVRVEAVSICGTDVHIVEVPPGFIAKPNTILGHELAGIVEQVGKSVNTVKPGDRVVVNPNYFCGVCHYCKLNLPNHCENLCALGINIDGAFAKYCKVSERVCHKISHSISADIAAFGEPLACVINGTQKVRIQPGESSVILGAGPIGILFLRMFKVSGASKVVVSEPSEYRRGFAKECGADVIVDPVSENLQDVVLSEIPGSADIVVDTVGSLFGEGAKLLRRGGKLLVFGVNRKAVAQFPQCEVTFRELQILGSWLANASFPVAVSVIESGALNLGKLITHKFPLERIHEGIELLAQGKAIKVIINP